MGRAVGPHAGRARAARDIPTHDAQARQRRTTSAMAQLAIEKRLQLKEGKYKTTPPPPKCNTTSLRSYIKEKVKTHNDNFNCNWNCQWPLIVKYVRDLSLQARMYVHARVS